MYSFVPKFDGGVGRRSCLEEDTVAIQKDIVSSSEVRMVVVT